eukprot:SAG22_NODE_892_length_6646_cov_21.438369_2_plen_98_part_00
MPWLLPRPWHMRWVAVGKTDIISRTVWCAVGRGSVGGGEEDEQRARRRCQEVQPLLALASFESKQQVWEEEAMPSDVTVIVGRALNFPAAFDVCLCW